MLESNSQWLAYLERYKVPPCPPPNLDRYEYEAIWNDWNLENKDHPFTTRSLATEKYHMWALVDLQWTVFLAQQIEKIVHKPRHDVFVLEIMAGAGWLAQALDYHGYTHYAATDSEFYLNNVVYPVQKKEAVEAIEWASFWKADVLICSWPHMNDTIVEAAHLWGTERPIVYIGEEEGCNAPPEFHKHFRVRHRLPIPTWDNVHDDVTIGYWRE